ncbi:Uncharacterised protein [Klebsiella pneumoniae]|nr:Uncharacterised protein [Klebsiella pneumoniae]SVM38978.1 Uncharacterised protein [Klebsiella pneumoniae]SVM41579.1 Uncharacterised protein [Klebsiella pneumoniae]SVQ32752.1 Uncharacterised protein [Klebsiella pneumoniae]SWV45420.1 Uncharacterised protein [Klebsiella pneumoniae]
MVSYCHCLTALQLYPFHTMTASAWRGLQVLAGTP